MNRGQALRDDGWYRDEAIAVAGALRRSAEALGAASHTRLLPNEEKVLRYRRLVSRNEEEIVAILRAAGSAKQLEELSNKIGSSANSMRDAIDSLVAKGRVRRVAVGHRVLFSLISKP